MKTKYLSLIITLFIALMACSCSKDIGSNTLIGDKDKIDIKGALSNGDMRNPNVEAGLLGKTLYVYFHDYMGVCSVTVTNKEGYVVFSEEQPTYPNAEVSFNMGSLRHNRYHLVISDGTDTAEGWFNNYRIVAVKPH